MNHQAVQTCWRKSASFFPISYQHIFDTVNNLNLSDTKLQCDTQHVVLVQVKSVQLIADGKAPRIPQTEEGASYEGIQKKSNAKVGDLTLNSASKSDIFRLIVKK